MSYPKALREPGKLVDLFCTVHGYSRLELIGTKYHYSVGWKDRKAYWWKWSEDKPLGYGDERTQVRVTFEEVLDDIPAHVQENLLFHLDLFI